MILTNPLHHFSSDIAWRFLLGLCVCLVGLSISAGGVAGETDEVDSASRFCEGLRQRGLYGLAETYCLDQLAQEKLSSIYEAQLKLELARTYLAHAGQALGDEQAQLRQSARDTVQTALESGRGSRWGAELLLLSAQISVDESNFLLQESRLFPEDSPLVEQTIASLRTTIDQLREVKKQLEQEKLLISGRFSKNALDISPFQHLMVRKETEFLIAHAMCDLGELQLNAPNRRGPAMRAVQSQLESLVSGAEDETLTWQARLLHLRTLGLLNDDVTFEKYRRDKLGDLPAGLSDSLVEESVELLLTREEYDKAAISLHEHRKQTGGLRSRLALLNLQALAALWQKAHSADQSTLADDLFQRIEQETQRAQAEVGGIWAWRCVRYRDSLSEARKVGPEIASKLRQARTQYQSSELAAAAETYGELVDLARDKNQSELVPELLFTQGSILLQLNRFEEASTAFHLIYEDHSKSDRSSQAHLLWAYCLGKKYEQSPTQVHREQYTIALQEHLDQFPGTTTWGDAALMLGNLEERRLQVTKAIEHYLRVPDDHPKAVQAHLSLLRGYEKVFARLKELNQPLDAWQVEAVRNLTSRTAGYPAMPEQLDSDRARVLLSLARLKLEPTTTQFDEADALLARVILASELHAIPPKPGESLSASAARWQEYLTEARQLRIISLASRGKPEEAEALLQNLSASGPDDLLKLLHGLSRIAAQVDGRTAREIAELQLQMTLALDRQRDRLSAPQAHQLDLCLAEAYAATAHSHEAILQYEKILQRDPKSGEARREVAQLLMQCGTKDCYRRALEQWRQLEVGTKQGTTEWFAVRRDVIESLIGIGDIQEANRLFRATELLYPEFGGPTLKADYERLKAKLPK